MLLATANRSQLITTANKASHCGMLLSPAYKTPHSGSQWAAPKSGRVRRDPYLVERPERLPAEVRLEVLHLHMRDHQPLAGSVRAHA